MANRLVCALVVLAAATAAAQKPKVAVLPFNGPQGARAQGEVVRALRKRADIVPQAAWDASAKKLFATSHSANDIAAVAGDLGVAVVVTGVVKRDGGWVLTVSARAGATGKPAEKLKYPLRGPRLDPATLRRLADDIGPAFDKALAGGATAEEEPKENEVPPAAPPPGTTSEEENPLAPKKEKEEPPAPAIERPVWAPYVDGSLAFLLSGRNFSFDQSGQPQFRSSVAAGLRVDASVYPLAFLATRPGAGTNAITGLGAGATFDAVFWPDSIPCTRDMSGNCLPTTERYGTSEHRIEAGLRWHWNFLNAPMRPDLLVTLQFGNHAFTIDKKPNGADVGPPDVSYSYLSIGVGARMPFLNLFAAFATLNVHILIDAGAIQSANEFGPGGGWGVRLAAGGEARFWRGMTARVSGFYEQFGLSFNGSTMPPPAKVTMGGATDQYYGLVIGLGYVF